MVQSVRPFVHLSERLNPLPAQTRKHQTNMCGSTEEEITGKTDVVHQTEEDKIIIATSCLQCGRQSADPTYCTVSHAPRTKVPVIPAFLNKCPKTETKALPSPLLLLDACSGRSLEVAIRMEEIVISLRIQLSKTPPQNHFRNGMEVIFAPGEEM